MFPQKHERLYEKTSERRLYKLFGEVIKMPTAYKPENRHLIDMSYAAKTRSSQLASHFARGAGTRQNPGVDQQYASLITGVHSPYIHTHIPSAL